MIPAIIYEPLPYIGIIVATLAIWGDGPWIKWVLIPMLYAYSIIIISMRKRYRSGQWN